MKKLYRNRLMQLLLVLCLFNLVACQEYEIDSQPEAPVKIQVDAMDSYTALASSPGNLVFNISSNTPWTIISDQQWCKPTPAMSASSSLVAEVAVALESNSTAKQRVAKLTIKAEGITEIKVITITQVSKEDLVVIPFDEIVPTEGGDISFNIISNKAWEIIPSTQFLENIDKTSGNGTEDGLKEKITIKISKNAAARRSGMITVKTDLQERVFTITQDGVVIEQEDPSESGTIDFDWASTEKIVKIRSNTTWKVKVPKEYAHWLVAEAISDTELKITLLEQSNKLITRTGQILLSTVNIIPGFEDVAFEIAQKPAVYFNGTLDDETGYVKVTENGNGVVSNYALKKGHIAFDFESMNLLGGSSLFINMFPNVGNSNYNLNLRTGKACEFICGGTGFNWEKQTFTLTPEELNAIRKIEFFVEDDLENVGKLRLRLVINGKDMVTLKNKANCYVDSPADNPGQIAYLQSRGFGADSYYVIKTVTNNPAK